MRVRSANGGLSVHAIAGTYVVILAFDLPVADADRLMGFAIERADHTEHETDWLCGYRRFSEEALGLPPPPPAKPGTKLKPLTPVSTRDHPIQAFMWGDYRAKPDHRYTYRVLALEGKPGDLAPFAETSVTVETESEIHGKHGVFFNRGAAASQAWVEKYQHRRPDQIPGGQGFIWLSRGLEEAMLRFIGQATGKGHALRAALYEFQFEPVLRAFGATRDRGADVRIVVDEKRNRQKDRTTGEIHDVPREANLAAIAATGIADLVIAREANKDAIAHNKFIVHLHDGEPIAVWTGSTNVTDGGIFGHSNVGHEVRDRDVARRYLDLWTALSGDPQRDSIRASNDASAIPGPDLPPRGIATIFSPRSSLAALQWYAHVMDLARESVFFTAAFGVSAELEAVLAEDKSYLRYGLVEKTDATIELLKGDRDNRFSVGAEIKDDFLGAWAAERLTGYNKNVRYIHTKFMLIDPLSTDPIVISGSANFSRASTTTNDENMLVIRGSTRVADIYLSEFMRLFNHFYFRDQVPPPPKPGEPPKPFKPWDWHLRPVPDWAQDYYHPGYYRTKERELFA